MNFTKAKRTAFIPINLLAHFWLLLGLTLHLLPTFMLTQCVLNEYRFSDSDMNEDLFFKVLNLTSLFKIH